MSKSKAKTEKSATRAEKINIEDFIRVWQGAASADEVGAQFGRSPILMRAKANAYRRKGIDLKRFPGSRGARPLDISELNKIAQESLKKTKSKN